MGLQFLLGYKAPFESHVHQGPAARKGNGLAIGGQMIKAGQLEGDIRGLLGIIVLINIENGDNLGLFQRVRGNGSIKGLPLATTDRLELGQVNQVGRRENDEGIGGLELFLNGPGHLDVRPGDQGILAAHFGEGELQNVIFSDLLDVGIDVAMRYRVHVGLLLTGDV